MGFDTGNKKNKKHYWLTPPELYEQFCYIELYSHNIPKLGHLKTFFSVNYKSVLLKTYSGWF